LAPRRKKKKKKKKKKNTLSVAAEVQHPDSAAAKALIPNQVSVHAHWQEFEVVERLPPRKHTNL
jgi:hypothetical protein